jgi:hypothetical protein
LARGHKCLSDLYNRPERVIAVVSHSWFLRAIVTHHYFFNGDYRIFEFTEWPQEDSTLLGPHILKQWERTAAGGMGWSWTERAGTKDSDFPDEEAERSEEAQQKMEELRQDKTGNETVMQAPQS